jgi:hypothetical protein
MKKNMSLKVLMTIAILMLGASNAHAGGSVPAGASWYWQLRGNVNTTKTVKVYDVDVFDVSASQIENLKAAGKTVICYFSAGSYEAWRQDSARIPKVARGKKMSGWDELWIDVRNSGVRDLMDSRIGLAKSKGCDGVEPDNVDGFTNQTGFPLKSSDQVSYLKFLASAAHKRGLTIALKNSGELVDALVNNFDFAIVESCYRYSECDAFKPFIKQNKGVLIAEYTATKKADCTNAKANKFSLAYYAQELDGSRYIQCK